LELQTVIGKQEKRKSKVHNGSKQMKEEEEEREERELQEKERKKKFGLFFFLRA
jgi:hypothetical protein